MDRQPLIRRKSRWRRPDYSDSFDSFKGRPEPKRRAPSPPQQTVVNDRARGAIEFRVVKKIGEGGQGRCDLFERKSDGKQVVYKLMKSEIEYITTTSGERKPKEACILMEVLGPSHPRIIQLYHWVTPAPGQTAFYMEYCAGGDLYDLIKTYHSKHNLKIPESFVWHVYLQLAEALGWLQEGYDRKNPTRPAPSNHQAIVHRDIKPQNIFIRKPRYDYEYPDIVLADFGIATHKVTSCERAGDYLGTFAYQGPEIPLHSRSGDTWSIGACIHEMTIGHPPISRTPRGYGSDWYCRPEARKVSSVRKRGYGRDLEDALRLTLRNDPRDRVKGSSLVEAIMRAIERFMDAGGQKIQLERWALPR